MDLVQERDPDFFRFHEAHTPTAAATYVVESEDGRVVGCGTHVIRDAWVGGDVIPVGYVCDIRLLPEYRSARVFPIMARVGLERARETHGTELFYVSVLDHNAHAVATATHRNAKRVHQPISTPLCPFHMVNVPFTTRQPPPRRHVASASASDADELVAFLRERQRARPFGYVFDRKLLERRLRSWPGLKLEDFLIVRDDRGGIIACAAPWDTYKVKRTRVLAYHGWMRGFRSAFNFAARLGRFQPMPEAGGVFRFAYLTHLEVENENPSVLRDLLRAAYARWREQGTHFLSVMIPRSSPLRHAFRAFPLVNRTPVTLYTVRLAESARSDVGSRNGHPGFEMALA